MSPTLRKELRIVWLPLAMACLAAFVCGGYYVNDPLGPIISVSKPVRVVAEWCPGILCISLAIIAAMAFGAEYQQRTIQLLLVQPVSRSTTWNQKSAMLIVCAALIALVWFVGSRTSLHYHWGIGTYAEGEVSSFDDILLSFGAFFLATLCSASYWSLVARSVIGGVVLNGGFQLLTGLCIALIAERLFKLDNAWRAIVCASPFYSIAFLFLGRRKFLRLQVTTPFGSEYGRSESFAALKWNISWLRPARRGAFVNLLRKEIRLNKPLFVISAFYLLSWLIMLLVFSAAQTPKNTRESVIIGASAVYMCIVFGLAGSVSLGEEKTLGTHTAQLVLPVARWRLWSSKLLIAIALSIVLGLVLPSVGMKVPLKAFKEWSVLGMMISGCITLTVIGFWAATHFQNSITAVLATVLFVPFLGMSALFGGQWLSPTNSFQAPILTVLTIKFHLSPYYFHKFDDSVFFQIFTIAICLVLLAQSLREFSQIRQTGPRTLRRFFAIFAVSALSAAWFTDFKASIRESQMPLVEARNALWRAVPKTEAARDMPADRWIEVPFQQLVNTRELSKPAAEWLRTSKISVFGRLNSPNLSEREDYSVQVLFPHEPTEPWIFDLHREELARKQIRH